MNKSVIILMAAIVATMHGAAVAETVKLADGTTLQNARLVRLTPATFIVQTGETLLELTSDEIAPGSLVGRKFKGDKAPVIAQHYEEINADGSVTMYWTLPLTNDGKKAITETRWGLAPWERKHAEKRTYVDDRGMTMVPTYDPPMQDWSKHPDQRILVTLPLAVPLAPGESIAITGKETTDWTKKTAEGIVYSRPGDYAEDRLIWRKVRLPVGAQIVRMTPQPSARFNQNGHEYLMWRRFYQKGEVYPLEVVFTLEDR